MQDKEVHYMSRHWTWSAEQWDALWRRLHADKIQKCKYRRIARQKAIQQRDPQKRE